MRLLLLACLAVSTLRAAPVEIVPAEWRGAVQPQVAVAPSGRVHVVFGKGDAIYHTSSADGRAFSAPAKVGGLEKLALRMRRGPRVAATDGRLLVTAISHADGDLHAWTSADGGQTWRAGAALNTVPKAAREGLHAVAGDGRGLVAAVWLDLRSGGAELRGRVSHDGGATWGADTGIYASPDGHICECCAPGVALGPHGEIAALWRNWLGGARDLWATVSTDGGAHFAAARKLGSGSWKLTGCPMDGGGVAVAADGGLHSVWRRESSVFAARGPEAETLLATKAAQPLIVRNGEKLATFWEAGGSLWWRMGEGAAGSVAARGRMASAAALGSGFMVVWEEGDGEAVRLMAETLAK